MLHMLLVCIRSYLKSVMRYKYLISDTYHPNILYLCEQGCQDTLLFFDAKRGVREQNILEFCANLFRYFDFVSFLLYKQIHMSFLYCV